MITPVRINDNEFVIMENITHVDFGKHGFKDSIRFYLAASDVEGQVWVDAEGKNAERLLEWMHQISIFGRPSND